MAKTIVAKLCGREKAGGDDDLEELAADFTKLSLGKEDGGSSCLRRPTLTAICKELGTDPRRSKKVAVAFINGGQDAVDALRFGAGRP